MSQIFNSTKKKTTFVRGLKARTSLPQHQQLRSKDKCRSNLSFTDGISLKINSLAQTNRLWICVNREILKDIASALHIHYIAGYRYFHNDTPEPEKLTFSITFSQPIFSSLRPGLHHRLHHSLTSGNKTLTINHPFTTLSHIRRVLGPYQHYTATRGGRNTIRAELRWLLGNRGAPRRRRKNGQPKL